MLTTNATTQTVYPLYRTTPAAAARGPGRWQGRWCSKAPHFLHFYTFFQRCLGHTFSDPVPQPHSLVGIWSEEGFLLLETPGGKQKDPRRGATPVRQRKEVRTQRPGCLQRPGRRGLGLGVEGSKVAASPCMPAMTPAALHAHPATPAPSKTIGLSVHPAPPCRASTTGLRGSLKFHSECSATTLWRRCGLRPPACRGD